MSGQSLQPRQQFELTPYATDRAQRVARIAMAALGRLLERQNPGGFALNQICYIGQNWLALDVDCERLHHTPTTALKSHAIVGTLADCVRYPVLVDDRLPGVVYFVRVGGPLPKPLPAAALPRRAELDLTEIEQGKLIVPVGVGRGGPVLRSLPDLGHAMIAGATGAGKSTWLHSALAAMLTANAPDTLRVVLLDPKRSELTPWAGVPHLLGDVAHTVEEATRELRRVVIEIDRRGDLLASVGARDMAGYNRRAAEPLPYILIVIDECLDLALEAGDRSELVNCLKIIAIRGRSAGVILWAATQHAAAVSGLPRVVNVNLATRLVFRVSDLSAAQVAGCPGAQNISATTPGRMIAKLGGEPVELQSYCVDDAILDAIARSVSADTNRAAPALSGAEAALVRWAIVENKGELPVHHRMCEEILGIKPNQIEKLFKRWESRGWLTPPPARNRGRQVTDALKGMIE